MNDAAAIRFFDIPAEENVEAKKQFVSMAQEDTQILTEMDKKID
jgi:hypothetical protein